MDYEGLKTEIDAIYPELQKIQEEWLKRHWESFNSEKAELEGIVAQEFGKVIGEISPIRVPHWILSRNPDAKNPEILDYKVEYNPQSKEFRVKVTKLKLPNGKVMDNADVLSSQYGCPHVLLESVCGFEDEIHPRVRRFKEEYSVRDINYPKNNCHHQ